MNFKHAYIFFMIASLLLTAGLVVIYVRRGWCSSAAATCKEGFESGLVEKAESAKSGLVALTDVLYKTMGRLEKFKAEHGDDFLKERIGLARMSITDLARMHLKSLNPA